MDPKVFIEIQKILGNKFCVDCGTKEPDWGVPGMGILVCIQCSGKHRGLGVHISFVRSVRMDVWTDKQIQFMLNGGNTRLNDFIIANGLTSDKVLFTSTTPVSSISTPVQGSEVVDRPTTNSQNKDVPTSIDIQNKYDTPQIELYKQVLIAQYEGKSIPTELPPPRQPKQQSTSSTSTSNSSSTTIRVRQPMQGFGSSPIPSQKSHGVGAPIKAAIIGVGCVTAAVVVWMLVPH